jgi:hypothetical protein
MCKTSRLLVKNKLFYVSLQKHIMFIGNYDGL